MRVTAAIIVIVATLVTAASAFDRTYANYGKFLAAHVCKGGVSYATVKSDTLFARLKTDFAGLSRSGFDSLPENDRIAYLVNAYNFWTIVLIVDNLPLKKGIRDISSPWGKKSVRLFGEQVSLDHIEHDLLRAQFGEPRVHFALVCASKSCPVLQATPFAGRTLDAQLTVAARQFLTDPSRNQIAASATTISRIFDWYGGDFDKKYGGYAAFITQVTGTQIAGRVRFLDYDWSLNAVVGCP
jgi:hypothetical protein